MRAALLMIAACGRLGFDAGVVRTDPDASASDGVTSDVLVTPPPGMIVVPATTFDFEPGTPWKRAGITHGFFMDRDEITVGRFRTWLAAGRPVPCDDCPLDPRDVTMHWHAAWNAHVQTTDFTQPCSSPWVTNGSTFPIGDDTMPMNCFTWTQAIAFCAWDGGKRLPTQVEWNLEARGGDHRTYVWGDTGADCSHATYDACTFPVAVGSAPSGESLHGARDLNGSLWEWGWDATTAALLQPSADDVPADSVDWSGVQLGDGDDDMHVIAGGEWGEDPSNMDLVAGNHHAPGVAWQGQTAITTTGARCVRSF